MAYKNNTNKKFLFLTLSVVFLIGITTPFVAQAQDATQYKLLEPLPGVTIAEGSATSTASDYIQGIVTLVIAIASVLAVLRIIFAGIKYMSTDAFQGKSEAKGDIQNAIWGLALAMSAWLILNTINPDLTKFNFDIPGLRQGSAIGDQLGASFEDKEVARDNSGCIESCVAVLQNAAPFPNNPPPNACKGAVCFVDGDLYNKLGALQVELNGEKRDSDGNLLNNKFTWVVTEMMPPTVIHSQPCQKKGTAVAGMCVDASIKTMVKCANKAECFSGTVADDADQINKFIKAAEKAGLYVEYEVPNDGRRDGLIKYGVHPGLIITVGERTFPDPDCPTCHAITQTISEHFSVYLNRSVKK